MYLRELENMKTTNTKL